METTCGCLRPDPLPSLWLVCDLARDVYGKMMVARLPHSFGLQWAGPVVLSFARDAIKTQHSRILARTV